MSDRCSWVQVLEPKSKEYIYVNLGTGECLWEPPSAVSIKKSDNNEWWELFDKKTQRFYYYSTHLQTTVWHRPVNCDIIPLAKLQMLKCQSVATNNQEEAEEEDKDVADAAASVIRKEISTQTSSSSSAAVVGSESSKAVDASQVDESQEEEEEGDEPVMLVLDEKSDDHSEDSTDGLKSSIKDHDKLTMPPFEVGPDKQDLPVRDDGLPVLPPRSPQVKTQQQPLYDVDYRQAANNISSRHHHHWERHSHPEASRQPVRTLQRDLTYPSVPQRTLESPVSPLIHDSVSDLPRSYVFRRSPDCQILANEFTSSLAQLPLESLRPACFLRQESYPSATRDSSIGYAQEAGSKCHDASKMMTFQATPTSRPRAFPRTNPSYVGTYRRDRQGASYARIPVSLHHIPSVGNEDCFRDSQLSSAHAFLPLSARHQASNNGQSNYANFDETALDQRGCVMFNCDGNNSRRINTAFGTISKRQLSLWSSKDGAAALQYADPCITTGHHIHDSAYSGTDESDNLAHSSRTLSINRFSDHGLPPDGHFGAKVQRPYNGHAHPDRVADDAFVIQMRRRSEPEYVNVPPGHGRTKLATNNVKSFLGAHMETLVNSIPDSYVEHGRDSRCSDPPLCMDRISLEEYSKERTDDPCLHSSRGFSPRNSDGLPDIDCEDSDRTSAQSTPSPQTRQFQAVLPARLQSAASTSSTYHPSLRKKKWLDRSGLQPSARQSTLEKDWLLQSTDINQHRPVSMLTVSPSDSNVIANKVAGTLLQQMHIEQFVLENLNEHRKGILGKTVSVGHMLSWTKDIIQKPMIRTSNKSVKKEAPEVFKLILMYMGDRKTKDPAMQIALDITVRGWTVVELRDEIFIQLCRQTSKNPRGESAVQGWELLGICLAFFPPSSKFYSFLDDHIHKSIDAHGHTEKSLMHLYMVSCQRRLQWVVQVGAKRGLRKPSLEDVENAKKSLLEPSMFGSTLDEIMRLQKDQFPDRQLPWIQTALSERVLKLNGTQTEGIFRVPGDIDEVNALKVQCDRWNVPGNLSDPHLPASLLKLWYRELYEPLIPYSYYSQCLDNFVNPEGATAIVATLPEINRLVFTYLIQFLQEFAKPENASVTKMDVNNLAMVMAPNCLRCLSNDPKVIFENTRKEMGFIRTLIQSLDTSSVKDLL